MSLPPVVLTSSHQALLLDPAGFARRGPSAFAQLSCEILLTPELCEGAVRVLVSARSSRGGRSPRVSNVSPDEARRMVALADAEGAFGFDVEQLVRLFAEPALLAKVGGTLHPPLASRMAGLVSSSTATRRARPTVARRVARRSRPSAGYWVGVSTAAAVLLLALVLGVTSGDQRQLPTADDDGNTPTIRPRNANVAAASNRPEPVNGNPLQPDNSPQPGPEPDDPFHDPDLETDPEQVEPGNPQPDTPRDPRDPRPVAPQDPRDPDVVDDPQPRDPATPDPQDPQPRDPAVEGPDATTPNPTDPDPSDPAHGLPTALLTVTAFDGRGDFLAADDSELDGDSVRDLLPGQTISLTRGTLSLRFLDGTGGSFGRLVLSGRTEVRLAPESTVDAPVIEMHHGELLLDTGMLPAERATVPADWQVRIGRDGHDLAVSMASFGVEPFAATVDCSRTRLSVQVLSGGSGATLGGTALTDIAIAVLAFRDGDVDTRARQNGLLPPPPAWVARAGLARTDMLASDFESEALAEGWGGTRVVDPSARPDRDGNVNHVLRMVATTEADNADPDTQRAGFTFAVPTDADSRLPNWSGMVLRVRVRADKATRLTIHFFDGAIRENFSVDLPIRAGWQDLEFPLTQFRNRVDGSATSAAQRFQNLSLITPDDAGAVDIDDLRLLRELR